MTPEKNKGDYQWNCIPQKTQIRMWKVEVAGDEEQEIGLRVSLFYIFSDACHGGNPNKVDRKLHKGSLSFPFTKTEVLIKVQAPQGEWKAKFVDIVENHRPVSSCNCLCLHLLLLARTSPLVSVLSKFRRAQIRKNNICFTTGPLSQSDPDRLHHSSINTAKIKVWFKKKFHKIKPDFKVLHCFHNKK